MRGRLCDEGWGASQGFPGLVLDPEGEPLAVDVFSSGDLPDHRSRLDTFEGDGYRRVLAEVSTPDGILQACIYVLASAK